MQIQANKSTIVVIDGKEYIYFGGTNYLGLSHREELLKAATEAFEQFGFSAGASRLTSGENTLLMAFEQELAEFARAESAVLLPAGFVTNAAVVDALDEEVDVWIAAANAHGSIINALAQSRKGVVLLDYPLENIRERAKVNESCTLGIFTEPVDPLLGIVTDVQQLCSQTAKQDYVILDEAHSFGVLGAAGRGAFEHFNLSEDRVIRTGTMSKALGTSGGFVIGLQPIIDRLKTQSSYFKLSTPLSPVVCAAAQTALRLLRDDSASTIHALKKSVARVNKGLVELGYSEFADHQIPIYHLSNSIRLGQLRDELPKLGIFVPAVTRYFADSGQAGLRWTVQAGHTEAQLDKLLDAIGNFS